MKVQAKFHLHQQVGSISVERVQGSTFDLSIEDARQAHAAGLIETLEDFPKKKHVPKNMETI